MYSDPPPLPRRSSTSAFACRAIDIPYATSAIWLLFFATSVYGHVALKVAVDRTVQDEARRVFSALRGVWGWSACLAWGAEDLVRNADRLSALESDSGVSPQRLRAAVEAVEDTRLRFQLNVSEELACESLAYRLERMLAA